MRFSKDRESSQLIIYRSAEHLRSDSESVGSFNAKSAMRYTHFHVQLFCARRQYICFRMNLSSRRKMKLHGRFFEESWNYLLFQEKLFNYLKNRRIFVHYKLDRKYFEISTLRGKYLKNAKIIIRWTLITCLPESKFSYLNEMNDCYHEKPRFKKKCVFSYLKSLLYYLFYIIYIF